ncbi:MAG: PD-(D/E)XK nuclease family protein [Methylocella sp.]
MPHPKSGYFLANGAKCPGTTTIIGRFKDSGALIKWAYDQGKSGLNLYETRDKAAEAGTLAHAMVEARIKGEKLETPLADAGVLQKAIAAFGAYESWAKGNRLRVVEQEMLLVSEKHRYGGTPDAIGELDGVLCLLDWKTSNAVYSDHLLQLAAYKILWEENHPDRLLTGGFHLCRFAKEHGDFAHHFYPNLDEAAEMFLHLRAAYEIDKQLKKRAA